MCECSDLSVLGVGGARLMVFRSWLRLAWVGTKYEIRIVTEQYYPTVQASGTFWCHSFHSAGALNPIVSHSDNPFQKRRTSTNQPRSNVRWL